MAVTSKALFRGAATTSTSTTLYTVPSLTTSVVTNIEVSNTASAAATFTISLDGVVLVPTVTVQPNSQYSWEGKQVIAAGKIITGGASTTAVSIHISGVEIA